MSEEQNIWLVVLLSVAIVATFGVSYLLNRKSLNTNHDFTQEELHKIRDFMLSGKLESTYQRCTFAQRRVVMDMVSKRHNLFVMVCFMFGIFIFVMGFRWINDVINDSDKWTFDSTITITFTGVLIILLVRHRYEMTRINSSQFKSKIVALKYVIVFSGRGGSRKRTSIAELQEDGTILYYVIYENLNLDGERLWEKLILAELYRFDDDKDDILVTMVRDDLLE